MAQETQSLCREIEIQAKVGGLTPDFEVDKSAALEAEAMDEFFGHGLELSAANKVPEGTPDENFKLRGPCFDCL